MNPDRARELLEAERRRLQSTIDAAAEDQFGEAEQERSSDVLEPESHPADQAQEIIGLEEQQSFVEHAHAELREIEHALRKVEDGTYGLDEDTGEPIPDERLEAVPATRYTVDNQRRDEKRAGIPDDRVVGNARPDDRVVGDPTATSGGGRLAR